MQSPGAYRSSSRSLDLTIDSANDLLGELLNLTSLVDSPSDAIPDEPFLPSVAVADPLAEMINKAFRVPKVGQFELSLTQVGIDARLPVL